MGTTTNGGNNNKMINRCYMTAGAYTKYVWGNNSPSARALSLSPSLCPSLFPRVCPGVLSGSVITRRGVLRPLYALTLHTSSSLSSSSGTFNIIIMVERDGGGGGGRRAATFNIIIGTRLPCKCLLWEFVGRRRVVGIDPPSLPPLRPIQLPRPLLPCLT